MSISARQSKNHPNKTTGSTARFDVEVENHFSLFIFRPLTPVGEAWIEENVSREGFHPNWPTLVVEHRYAANLADGMSRDGLSVGRVANPLKSRDELPHNTPHRASA